MKLLKTINPEKATKEEISTYRIREAARAVILDNNDNVALLYVGENKYHKLPGGGIDDGEKPLQALQRECLEEIGCEIEVLGEVGKIIEHRKIFQLEQISYCYFGRVRGPKGEPNFTEKELSEGFKQLWVPYQEAIELISNNVAVGTEGKEYIVPRDTVFINAAKDLI